MSTMPRLVVFDLDGTLALSKTVMDQEMSSLLQELLKKTSVAVISGGSFEQFEKQFLVSLQAPESLLSRLYLFPTCGAQFFKYGDGWKQVYAHTLTAAEKAEIFGAFESALSRAGYQKPEKLFGEVIEDRGTQVTFSALGQKAPVEIKSAWDPDQKKRLLIKNFLDVKLSNFEVRIGGTTSIDVTRKGIDKAYGVAEMEKHLSIPIDEMVFVGDALFPGGNDYAVLKSGVKGVQTSGPEETKKIIREVLETL